MLRYIMREAARASAAKSRQTLQPTGTMTRRASGKRKSTATKDEDSPIKSEPTSPEKPSIKRKRESATQVKHSPKKIKTEDILAETLPSLDAKYDTSEAKKTKPADLQMRKLKAYSATAGQSPFPDLSHPTAAEAKLAHRILSDLHGARVRPQEVKAQANRAGCGDSPSVLDALVRTILSQNTSDTNSTRAKLSMDAVYGQSDDWEAIMKGGQAKLQEAIKCGGLSQVKSKVIINILEQAKEKYGKYSLDHLHDASNEDAMQEMLSFQGVGPKTASCVLLFCLQRESFAVDTHVWRISKLLGWVPKGASRDETHAHLDVMIPDEDKYGLHILMVGHGKVCDECKAGGKNTGKCELRKAFRQGKIKGEAGEDVKEEEEREIKQENKKGSKQGKVKAKEV
jgi:endonuclease-3